MSLRQGFLSLAVLTALAVAGCSRSDGPGTLPYGSGPDTPTNAAGPSHGPVGGPQGILRQPGGGQQGPQP